MENFFLKFAAWIFDGNGAILVGVFLILAGVFLMVAGIVISWNWFARISH